MNIYRNFKACDDDCDRGYTESHFLTSYDCS